MTTAMHFRQALSGAGLNRSVIVRRLVRLGHPRLRELRARALAESGPAALALRGFVRWIERGMLHVPQGHAGGLSFEMRYLPLSHAHIGSIAFGNLETAVQEAMVRHLGMLDEARRRKERGQEVVVGAVQPQLPPEAEAILGKLEVILLKQIGGGTALDVEAIIRRHPDACFIDGLAYDNPPGARHATRWEDAKELVQAGVKVIVSVNIQYITELREQVEAITGKHVSQTVPVAFIKSADEIEIVDAPPIEPIGRTPAEQTSIQERQQRLSRLREMALVLAADVVDHQLSNYLENHGIKQHFGAQERILVCITAWADAQEMLQTAQTIAQRFHGELTVATVNEPDLSREDQAALDEKMALARSIGARVEILEGHEPVDIILDYARRHGTTQLFIGHSHRAKLWSGVWGNNVNKLIQRSQGMDVRIFPNRK